MSKRTYRAPSSSTSSSTGETCDGYISKSGNYPLCELLFAKDGPEVYADFEKSTRIANEHQMEDLERRGGDINNYNHVHTEDSLPSFPVDWTMEDTDVQDVWFLPRTRADIVGNDSCIAKMDAWLAQWYRFAEGAGDPPSRVAMLIRGPPGIGKTTAVRVLLHQYGFHNIHEINTSDDRTKQVLNRRIKTIMMHCNPHRLFSNTSLGLQIQVDKYTDQ